MAISAKNARNGVSVIVSIVFIVISFVVDLVAHGRIDVCRLVVVVGVGLYAKVVQKFVRHMCDSWHTVGNAVIDQ